MNNSLDEPPLNQTLPSDWFLVDQETVSAFGRLTFDEQYIHDDPAAAAKTPLGGTIAQGFFLLSLLTRFSTEAMPLFKHPDYEVVMSMNYGFDKVRFITPVRTSKEIRGLFTLRDIKMREAGQAVLTYEVSIEIKGDERPALVANWLALLQLAPKT